MNRELEIGFVFYENKRDMDLNEINEIAKKIKGPTTLTQLPFDGNRVIIGIHNAAINLEQELNQHEFSNMCQLVGPIYGDDDEMDERMRKCYKNGILTMDINVFREYLK